MKRYGLALLITGVAVLMTTISITNDAFAGKAAKKRNDLTGTWLVSLQFDVDGAGLNPAAAGMLARANRALSKQAPQAETNPNAVTLAPFDTIETFHSEGTFAENSLIDYFPPTTTPGRGLWERIGEGEFSLTIYGTLTGSFDNPEFQGTYREASRIKTDQSGNTFTATAHVEIFDTSGNFQFAFDGTAQGRRAELMPAP